MSNKVYTYSCITNLQQAPYFAEIAALPQITMSREMATNMARSMRIFKGNIMGFSNFTMKLFPGWNTSGQKFAYAAALNQFLREKITHAKDKAERDWLFGCKKNLYAAINNIIHLEESKIRPEDLHETDRDMLLFIEMWHQLEKEDGSIAAFRKRREDLQNLAYFDQEVGRIFRFHGSKKIVWHGFQFLTPMQQFIYDLFSHAGYEIDALIQDDVRYPYANEIWSHLYNTENGYPDKSNWIRQKYSPEKNPLGEIFETGDQVSAPNVKILRYRNTVEFVSDIPRMKEEGFYLYCSDDRFANTMLKDYFPERYEVRNLLSYPIGQFIYTLHKMWDENRQCIILNQDGLRKCFASGWLSAHGKSSMNYTEDLERLLPYFDGCFTVDEWNERLQTFTDAYDEAIDIFMHKETGNPSYDRKLEALGNPFSYFGVFSVKEKHIEDVINVISQLIKMAQALFGANEPISIQQHMSKLDAMLYMNDGMPQELYLEERKKVQQIFKALESDSIKDFLCYPGDLAAALLSFMGGQIEDEAENNKGLRTLVFNIFQVESASLAANGKAHICMTDISRMPGTAAEFGWPLNEDVLRKLSNERQKSYARNWIENSRLTALSNRYYMYAALKNKQVEISWIQQQGEKLYSPSPYITLLDKFSDAVIQDTEVRKLDLQSVLQIAPHKHVEEQFDIRQDAHLRGYDGELEYSLCPMRFVYSYVLGDREAYRNEYQHNRAIVRFIQVLKTLLGDKYNMEQVAEQVFELFPYIRKAEKRQMIDDACKWALPDTEGEFTTFENENYTNRRFNLTFPDSDIYSCAKKQAAMLMSQEGRRGISYETGNPEQRNCEFCPHGSYCRESLFGIDYNKGR